MTGVGDDLRGRSSSRPWFAVGFLLAIGATLALVLTDDLRWVRLAVVAALWAALIGALMAAKYRKAVAASEKSAAKAQKIYELELEKEVAARREFELEVETEAKERAEADTREELDALREELSALRESLQTLFGGEVLWERVALTAQSTRMRSLGEEPRLVTAGEGAGMNGTPAQITVGADGDADAEDPAVAEVFDNPTELIGRIRDLDADPREGNAEEPPSAPEPQRRNGAGAVRTRFVPRPARPAEDSRSAQRPVDPPTRRVQAQPGTAMARASEAANRARAEKSRPQQRPVADPHGESRNGGYGTGYHANGHGTGYHSSGYDGEYKANEAGAEASAERSRPEQRPVPGQGAQPRNPRGHVPSRPAPPPAVENAPTRTQPPVEPTRPAMTSAPMRRSKPPIPPRVARPDSGPPTEINAPVTNPTNINPRDAGATDTSPTKVNHMPVGPVHHESVHAAPSEAPDGASGAEQTSPSALEPAAAEPNPTLPEEIRDLQGHSGGRRRRAEPDDEQEPPAAMGRRRRYRADEEPAGQAAPAGGRRRAPESAPAGHTEEASEPAGSHAEGRSVSELLAAYGASGSTPRRRRRAED